MRILVAFLFTMMINLLLFLSQQAAIDISQHSGTNTSMFGDSAGTPLCSLGSCSSYATENNASKYLPGQSGSTLTDIANIIIFPFMVALDWLRGTGAIFISFVTAVPSFIMMLGLPTAMAWAIGTVWYLLNVFIIFAWLKGNY